jgi:Cu(I)/Ag(I) efflux system membrane fusion protein
MKRLILPAAVLLLLGAAFLSGYWYRSASTPAAVSQLSNAGKQSEPATDNDASSPVPGAVRVSPEKQQLMGVRLAVAKKVSELQTLRVLGRVAPDETRIYRINAAVDGWIRETFSNTTGSIVKKDQILASFYSPEFLSAQQAFIFALGSKDRFKKNVKETPQQLTLTDRNVKQYRDSLRNIGMSDIQIDEIAETREYTESIHIRSPATGFVTLRNVTTGLRFDKGTELYRIADLSRIWIIADLFENEASYFQPGKTVTVTLPQQKKTLTAKVSIVLPQFDPATRTLKVRLETENPGYTLRPDMFVDVEIPVTFPPAVTVPAGAILDAGLRKTVFVDCGNGIFEPRLVETGWRFGDRVEIKSGLKDGERIVVSGNFLIDSESKMELAASGIYGTLVKDPVCGADVAVRKAEKTGRTSTYHGKTYYFSSLECKQQFDKDPKPYLEKPVKEHDQPCH